MDYEGSYASPLGRIILGSDGEALTGLWFEGQKYERSTLKDAVIREDLPVFAQARCWLDVYFSGRDPGFCPPLRYGKTAFSRLVQALLLEIPFGETSTYGALAAEAARRLGTETMSAQAVGGAVGHNPISLIIPCHRVLGADGSLTGYAGGLERKMWLLKHEHARCI